MWNRNDKNNWPVRSKERTAFVKGWPYTPGRLTEMGQWIRKARRRPSVCITVPWKWDFAGSQRLS